ncbi:hypothetical protein K8Z61_15055 [Nocardioides sp. TRM66260-LWL]|uniref:hypothetical protein n=1 Tax=Nocardioides sp. TRM66260-LWL TaxID=2874478 RepID=UPI001CC71354|nr:hypothetical protein [Nocardioides sp. TRM66260-LWL]MBZ5735811.1 hypothetical protein [Nocardioides sp. TRM66260-LWL]
MSDLLYVLVTLLSFGSLALLAGLIDRRLADPDSDHDADVPGSAADARPADAAVPATSNGGRR